MRPRQRILLCLMLLLSSINSVAQKQQQDSLVRLMSASSVQLIEEMGTTYRKVFGPARFLHNGTYLICDTAYWNVGQRVIKCFGHVQILQDQTVLTSDKLDYLIDLDLAQFRGGVVQLKDKSGNLLRTNILDYNTKDSVAVYRGGCAMKDKDGQIIESDDGQYYSDRHMFSFYNNVNMYSDSMFVKTNHLDYFNDENKAVFPSGLDAWRDKSMMSAQYGMYDRAREYFFFNRNVHMMNDEQESWTDSLYYFRPTGNLEMFGRSQMTDTTRNTISQARHLYYTDSLSMLTLHRDATIIMVEEQEAQKDKPATRDSVYFSGDTLIYQSVMRWRIPEDEIKASEERLGEISTDPVTEYRQKAAKAAADKLKKDKEEKDEKSNTPKVKPKTDEELDAEEKAASVKPKRTRKRRPNPNGEEVAEPTEEVAEESTEAVAEESAEAVAESSEEEGTPSEPVKAPVAPVPETGETSSDEGEDVVAGESIAMVAPSDSTNTAKADSLAVPRDSTKFAFLTGVGKVRMFRKDIQVAADSLRYTDLDSLVRMYRKPIIWNDGNRQYSADSISVMIKDGRAQKASLMSEAFIIVQEDSVCFDQIRGAEILAYFDTTSALKRLDALGQATALFYLEENDALATVNKVECKMFSAMFSDGTLDRVYYYDNPHNDAYPIVQMEESDRQLKGFNWQPELRPKGREEFIRYPIRSSERDSYAARPGAKFVYTDVYFPGYMNSVYKAIADNKLRQPKPKAKPEAPASALDTLASTDSLAARDSLAVADSLASRDSLAAGDTLAVRDSLAQKPAVADSLAAGAGSATVSVATEPKAPTKAELREQARKEREAKRAARQAAREARWAQLDSLDAIKAAEKQQKALERKRKRTLRQLEALDKEQSWEDNLRQKWIAIFTKRKQDGETVR